MIAGKILNKPVLIMGGCLLPSLLLFSAARADTIVLNKGGEIKGLVVEQHADRVIISTEQGEAPIMKDDIKNIVFEDPAQNFLQLGRGREAAGKYGEALAYYEMAVEKNPNLDEAKKAAQGVRNRFWAQTTQGPSGEVEKQQLINDSWSKGQPIQKLIEQRSKETLRVLRDGIGVSLEKKGDWVRLAFVDRKKDASLVGLKKFDRLVSIDGESLRYLSLEVVARELTEPRYSNYNLEYDRLCTLRSEGVAGKDLRSLGLKLKIEYQGLIVEGVHPGSAADRSGLQKGDLIVQINGSTTRYMSLRTVGELIRNAGDRIKFTVRRTVLLTRK